MAKVMSYEDLENACEARAARQKAAADRGKGKRGQRRKVSAEGIEGVIRGKVVGERARGGLFGACYKEHKGEQDQCARVGVMEGTSGADVQ
jgi:hypothetical protein